MHPRELDGDAGVTGSERLVFESLRDGLPEPWEAFHATGYTERDPATGSRDGEIDFVVVHPERGILCLEVKGGGVACRDGAWTRTHAGRTTTIRDPFEQAKEQRHALKRLISQIEGWDGNALVMGHAVAFPFASVHEFRLGPNAPPPLVLDRTALDDPLAAIEGALAHHAGARDRRSPPGADGVAMLRELLAPTVIVAGPLGAAILEDEAALIHLTNEQALLLRRLAGNRRMAIHGCAGSGKTMIAVEHAKRLAADGKRVLFVCFNKALREELGRGAKTPDGVEFHTFHGLCVMLAKRAGIELSEYPAGEAPPDFFERELPEALLEAAAMLDLAYDALFVDEAQDLRREWLDALELTLADPAGSPVWLFLDDNQDVYGQGLDLPSGFLRFDLSVNCRNTQRIHEMVRGYYRGTVELEARGPEGRDVELLHSGDQAATVIAVLDRLCGEEGVPTQDVVVLSSHGFEKCAVRAVAQDHYTFVPGRPERSGEVRLGSIRGFKGLESPVVVLCELEDLDGESERSQLYTGISRARTHCVIVAPPEATSSA